MARIASVFGGPSWTGLLFVVGSFGCFEKEVPASSSGTEVLPGDDSGLGDGGTTDAGGGVDGGGGSDDGGGEGSEGGDGVVEDADGDGFSVADGDCDDADDTVHPGAIDTEWRDRDCVLGISRGLLSTSIGGDADVVRLGIGLGAVPDQDGDGAAEVFATSQSTDGVWAHVWPGSALVEGSRLGVADAWGTVALPFSAFGYVNAREGGDVFGTGGTTSAVVGPWAGRSYVGVVLVDHARLASRDIAETAVVSEITFVDAGASIGVGQGLAVDADLDGDGFADVVVGMPYAGEGRACVHLASSIQTSPFRDNADADVIIVNDIDGNMGEGISTPGDLDGDGIDDLFVGAPYRRIPDAPAADYIGASYLFSGADVAAGRVASVDDAYITVVGNIGDRMGAEGRLIADVTGDGRPDLVVSGSGASYGTGYAQGALWVFDGQTIEPGALSLDDAHSVIFGGFSTDYIGFDYHDTEDMNGDGLPDLAVAGFADGGHQYVLDRAALLPGGVVLLGQTGTIAAWKSEPFSGLGFSEVATADVDGDGFGDLLIGAGFDTIDGVSSGAVYRLPHPDGF